MNGEIHGKKKYVILVRHGERADRAGLPIIFHEKDPQLTDKGKRQAYEAGNIIKSFLKETINENIDNIKLDIFSSPFTRTIQTSVQIRNNICKDKKIKLKNALCEYINIEFEGYNPSEVIGLYINHPKIEDEFCNEQFELCEDSLPKSFESETDIEQRMNTFANSKIKQIFENYNCDVTILVSHASPIDHLNRVMGYPGPYGWHNLPFCSTMIYSYDIENNKFEYIKKCKPEVE